MIYVLDKVMHPPYQQKGRVVMAEYDEKLVNLFAHWLVKFEEEAVHNSKSDIEANKKYFQQLIENKKVFYSIHNNEVTAMAVINRETRNTSTISLVYTPPQFRGNGYATFVVKELSDYILQRGKQFATLYTDLDNPTSNKIYQAVGFREFKKSLMLTKIKNED